MTKIETQRPLKAELELLNYVELFIRLVTDTAWAVEYRKEILMRSALENKPMLQLMREHFEGSNERQNIKPIIDGLLIFLDPGVRSKHVPEISSGIVASDWNFIDPIRAMKMDPDVARGFMIARRELAGMGETWESMTPAMKNTFWMICDAYCRYIVRVKNGS